MGIPCSEGEVGEAGWGNGSGLGRGRLGLYALGVVALLAVGVLAAGGGNGRCSPGRMRTRRRGLISPSGRRSPRRSPSPRARPRRQTRPEPEEKADQIQRAVKEPEPEKRSPRLLRHPLPHLTACRAGGRHHVPERSRDGHLGHTRGRGDRPRPVCLRGQGTTSGPGYPWVPGSNTYIAGHRLGYPGTPSDHVFWNLAQPGQGDEIYLTDSNGHTYTYAVSEILEVPVNDLSVTGPDGHRHGLAPDLHRGLRGLLDTGPELERPLHRQGDDGVGIEGGSGTASKGFAWIRPGYNIVVRATGHASNP